MLKQVPFHPWLLVTYHVLFFTSGNLAEIGLWEPLVLLAQLYLLVVVVFSCFYFLIRNSLKAGFCTTLVAVFVFAYGPLIDWRGNLKALTGIFPSADLVLALLGLVSVLGIVVVWRLLKEQALPAVNQILNVILITLVVLPLLNIGQEAWVLSRQKSVNQNTAKPVVQSGQSRELPDIYYILLDAYPRRDTLKRYYGIDNAAFVEALQKRGFLVGEKSCSSYTRTLLSTSSTFNMRYHDDVVAAYGKTLNNYRPYVEQIRSNKVASLLKENGYHYTHIGSWFAALRGNTAADKNISGPAQELSLVVWQSTSLNKIARSFFKKELDYTVQRNHTLFSLNALDAESKKQPASAQPRFVLAHIISPHLPLYFGPNGEDIQDLKNMDYPTQLKGNIDYLNQRMLTVVDAILASKRPAVIIIQGDHGTAKHGKKHPFIGETKEDAPEVLTERMAILSAIYMPPAFHISAAPHAINTFPVVFNQIWGSTFPLLPFKAYYAPPKTPSDFREVTRTVDCY